MLLRSHDCRAGHFTCPVRCGAIFAAQWTAATPPSADGPSSAASGSLPAEGTGTAEGHAAEQLFGSFTLPYVKCLNGAVDAASVIASAQSGALPPVLHRGRSAAGDCFFVIGLRGRLSDKHACMTAHISCIGQNS